MAHADHRRLNTPGLAATLSACVEAIASGEPETAQNWARVFTDHDTAAALTVLDIMRDILLRATGKPTVQQVREHRLIATWYRSLTPTGGLWAESMLPGEITKQSQGRTDLTYQRMDVYQFNESWQPWNPEEPC